MQNSSTTSEERALLQERIAVFSKWGFFLSAATDVLNVFMSGLGDTFSSRWFLDRMVTGVLLCMWLATRRRSRSMAVLHVIDAGGVFLIACGVTLMGRFLGPVIAPQVLTAHGLNRPPTPMEMVFVDQYTSSMIMLGGAVMYIFRAAIIPSTPTRTLLVTGVLGSPFVITQLLLLPSVNGALVFRSVSDPSNAAVGYVIWWTIVVLACLAISFVTYGLRRQVRDALRLGQYTLVEKLGEGGMGVVYRAQHARLRRPTAIKLLPPGHLTDEAVARFESEVQLTAALTHPNTVTVFDYGRTDDGVFYYAMEYLEGATLAEVVDVDGAQTAARVIRILAQTASALEEAHGVGLIHRDIKPANIMLTRQGVDPDAAKILDFGLAQPVDHTDDTRLTVDDRIVGTPMYMAPEIIKDASHRREPSDIYALGAVGYFLLTGIEVFPNDSIVEICAHHLHTTPVAPSQRIEGAILPELEELILQCLRKAPDDRPASAAEIVERLRPMAHALPWSVEDAEAWWERFGPELSQMRRGPERMAPVHLSINV